MAWGLRILIWVMACVPPVVFVYFFLTYSVNAPWSDDFDAILGFLNGFFPDNRLDAVFSLTRLHNEHRIVLTRFLAWGNAMLLGHVSFTALTVIANSSLFFLAGMLVYSGRQVGLQNFWLIPIPCLILACQDNSNMLIAMYGLQNLVVHAFAAAAFLTWNHQRILSALFGILAVCTSSCGLLVFPIMTAFEIYAVLALDQGKFTAGTRQRLLRQASFPFALSVIIWGLYFWGYQSPPHHPSLLTGLMIPHRFLQYIVLLIGSPLVRFGHPMTHVIGLGFLCLLGFVLWKTDWRRHAAIVCLILFELGTMFIIASARCGFGSGHPYNTRYRIISLTLWACTYLLASVWLLPHLKSSRIRTVGIAFASLAVAFNLLTARDSRASFEILSHAINEQLTPQLAITKTIEDSERFYQIAVESESKGLFHWPYLHTPASSGK
jgi:hypothetical protein